MEHFSLSFLGFNRQQVNEVINKQEKQIQDLQRQLEQLQSSQQELTEEVENYRQMEDALQQGILDARVTGKKIIDDSSMTADKLMQQTQEQVNQYKEDFAFHSRELAESGHDLKENLQNMKKEFQKILDSYQDMLDSTDFDRIYPQKYIERLLIQVSAYEDDETMDYDDQIDEPIRNQPMSDEEKLKLEQLINEVITNERVEEETDPNKFIDFSKIKNSQEG
ncbi:DivIVA domain-containing protein [Ignavigranum ruoffiae]|uniref:DivIVA protein n=1 Tax=Ignavigranum ruoffiae TaxID=89093 RepID=A0A1H9FWM9_9LACT|nr:DivIVA domain-containing protein [Ignavigranum ruoffiae]UPQ85844.1 DivIVA domain-containing protein [Ignavigranum ruoffiae]SEQ42330.1 DivIVA protein [Ignavigranum ruoffiae]